MTRIADARPQDGDGEAEQDIAGEAPSPTYHHDAVASALAVVRRAVSADTAAVLAAVLRLRRPGDPAAFALVALGEAAGFGGEPEAIRERLRAADTLCREHLGAALLSRSAGQERRDAARRRFRADLDDEDAAPEPDDGLVLSDELLALLDMPHPAAEATDLPVPDATTAAWVAACRAAARSGAGHHLALRVAAPGGREAVDVAGLVAADGTRVALVTGAGRPTLAGTVVRAELHAGGSGHVVVVAADLLVAAAKPDEDDDDTYAETSWTSVLAAVAPEAVSAAAWLRGGLRNTYLWQVPAAGGLPRELDGLVAGCVGPLGTDRAWSEGVVAALLPGLGAPGVAALLAQVRDPRDAAAMAAMARATATGTRFSLDEAAKLVARSFGAHRGGLAPALAPPPAFDPRLITCDHDVERLLARAEALAAHGGRVMFHGPPGGGKSSLAQALARAMTGAPAVTVTAADVLAYRWGAMERRLAALWSRAASEGAVLVIDELDALCGARDGAGSGNNSYLIRCLTDSWLQHLDVHASVPVLATVNDPGAVDAAIRRRFAFVVAVGDALPPERERLAWTAILGLAPPEGWTPCGASVADVALAKRRCAMLGEKSPRALAEAIERARAARLRPGGARRSRGGSVH